MFRIKMVIDRYYYLFSHCVVDRRRACLSYRIGIVPRCRHVNRRYVHEMCESGHEKRKKKKNGSTVSVKRYERIISKR